VTGPIGSRKPLKCRISRGVLKIEIGLGTLAHAAEQMYDAGHPRSTLEVTNPYQFARDVAVELCEEDEYGDIAITRMLDRAIEDAVDNGSEHVREVADGEEL
jgi:hypothetical protein